MHLLPALPAWHVLAVVAVLATIAAVCLSRLWPLAFLCAFLWTVYNADAALRARLPETLDRSDISLSGRVDDFPEHSTDRTRFSFLVAEADLPMLQGQRVRLSWYQPRFAVLPGQRLSLTARVRTPHGLINPGGFDYERWLLTEGVAATGYVREIHSYPSDSAGITDRLLQLRSAIRESIYNRVPSSDAANLITALTIGERSGFSDSDWEVFRRTGTSHLIAISGLHIGIVAMVVLWATLRICRALGGRFSDSARGLSVIVALCAAAAYAALAGFSLSTVRAVVMLAAAMLIVTSQRRVSPVAGFGCAVILITAADPLAPLGSSFWLSFGAVATLLLAASARQAVQFDSRIQTFFRNVIGAQLAVSLVAVPAGAIFFQHISVMSFAVNIAAIPFFSLLLVPATLVCVSAEMLIGLPPPCWLLLAAAADFALAALQLAAAVPWASFRVPSVDLLTALFASAVVLLALPWNPLRSRFVGILGAVLLIWPRTSALPEGRFRLTALDVGHGLAVLIETRSSLTIYDTGASFVSGFNAGADILLPALAGRLHPQRLIISHGDNDHAGGAHALLEAYPELTLLSGPDIEFAGDRRCVAGQGWLRDGVEFRILHPAARFPATGNDSSCVLQITAPGGRALLTGDIERSGEAALLNGADISADVVIAPHHGSETSSSAALVRATSPSIAIFSAGYGNRWNFPRESVVRRWCAGGAEVYVTGEEGAITVVLGNETPQVGALRRRERRYWRTVSVPRCGESTDVTL